MTQTIRRILDNAGRVSINTIFGDALTVVRESDVALRWPYNINTYENITTTSGSGSVNASGDMAVVSTGATVGSIARLESVNLIRYRPGSEVFCMFTTVLTCSGTIGYQQGVAGSIQAVGIFDANNGFAIGFNGIQFGIRWRVSGIDTWIPQTQFNRDGLVTVDLTKIQLWRISFGWFGGAPIFFEYLTEDGVWTLFHVINIANKINVVSIHNPSLQAAIETISSSSTTNVIVKVGCIEGGSSRPPNVMDIGYRHFHYSSSLTLKNLSSGTTIPMLSIQNPITFQGITNKTMITVIGGTATMTANGSNVAQFTAIFDATLTGASFSALDSVNSVAQVDNSATAFSGGASARYGINMTNGTALVDLNGGPILVYPGHTLTVTGTATGNATGIIDINWKEAY